MNADEVKAIVSEALARQKAESAAELLELKEKLELSNHWARDLKVRQEQAITEANKEATSKYLRKHFLALGKRIRFNKRETESYHVALASLGGWKTEKKYRADSIFSDDDPTPWHLKPEPSTEKKMEAENCSFTSGVC